jgi:hypothetical protein
VSVVGPAATVDALRAGVVAFVKSGRVGLVEPDPPLEDVPPAPDVKNPEDGD